jgi:hypothetical protein
MRLIIILFIISVVHISCNNNVGNELNTTHPTSSNLLPYSDAFSILNIDNDELNQDYESLVNLIKYADTLYSVETQDSNFNRVIGMIDDLATTSSGEMFVLDSRQFTVHQFDSTGELKGTIGRQGSGPGEFMNPQKIMVYSDSLLLVSDATKIEIFNISSEPQYVETVNLKHGVSSICSIGDTLYTFSNVFLHRYINDENDKIDLIHAYNISSFEHLYSFGRPYQSNYPDIVQRLSAGNMVCNEESGTVSFLYQFIPLLKAYSAKDGELEWSTRFDDLNLPRVSTTLNEGRVRFAYSRNENINDFFFEPLTIKGTYILVQLTRSFQDENREDYTVSYIIDSSSGKGEFIPEEIPHVMSTSNQYFATRDIHGSYFPSAKMLLINNRE